jgi:hypothetical protein
VPYAVFQTQLLFLRYQVYHHRQKNFYFHSSSFVVNSISSKLYENQYEDIDEEEEVVQNLVNMHFDLNQYILSGCLYTCL